MNNALRAAFGKEGEVIAVPSMLLSVVLQLVGRPHCSIHSIVSSSIL